LSAGGQAGGNCAGCGAHLAREQRYCLACGERVGARGGQLDELVRRARAPAPAPTPTPASIRTGGERGGGELGRERAGAGLSPAALIVGLSAFRLPSARISALLVLAFVGFGALLGNVARNRPDYALAASSQPRVKLLLPAAGAGTGAGTSSTIEAAPASEPPLAAAQATPESPLTEEASSTPTASAPSPPNSGGKAPAGSNGAKTTAPAAATLPAIKHVFLVVLSDQPYAGVFGPESKAPYLARTLERRGELLVRYYAVAHAGLADGIALLSGQGPTPATAADCPLYGDVAPATAASEGQVLGDGCVYPSTTQTLPGQLAAKHLKARAYVQGIDEAGSAARACAHPAPGAPDPASAQPPSAPYAGFRNPFVYFHSLTDSPACASTDVGLSALARDLSRPASTPSFSYIVPDRCHDGSAGPCPGGAPGGLPAADGFLRQVVPGILASKAYKQGGLLLITTDQAPTAGEFADSSSCCGQPRFPNLPAPSGAAASLPPEGGGQVGALMLSPYVKGHAISQEPYDHYSLLRTIEDLFGLAHLGYAAGPHVSSLEPSLFQPKPAR